MAFNRKKYMLKWSQSKIGKESIHTSKTKYYQSEQGKKTKQKENINYRKTKGYKKAHRKTTRKSIAKRKRNLNWILMFPNPFNESVPVEYHHINNAYVVAIPKDLHQLYGGKNHRESMIEIVKQIYLESD